MGNDTIIRVELPSDLAAALIQDDLAVLPSTTRGGTVVDVVRVAMENLPLAADVVTIAMAVPTLRRILSWFLDLRPSDHAESRKMIVEVGTDAHRINIDDSTTVEHVAQLLGELGFRVTGDVSGEDE